MNRTSVIIINPLFDLFFNNLTCGALEPRWLISDGWYKVVDIMWLISGGWYQVVDIMWLISDGWYQMVDMWLSFSVAYKLASRLSIQGPRFRFPIRASGLSGHFPWVKCVYRFNLSVYKNALSVDRRNCQFRFPKLCKLKSITYWHTLGLHRFIYSSSRTYLDRIKKRAV